MSQDFRRGTGGSDLDTLVHIDVRRWLKANAHSLQTVPVSKPREVACFSRSHLFPSGGDEEAGASDIVRLDFGSRAELRSFKHPALDQPLDAGMETCIQKALWDESDGHGAEPLCACFKNANFDIRGETDFVAFRGDLTNIGNLPYSMGEAFAFDAVCIGTTVFMEGLRLDEEPPDETHARFIYMGFKFEAMCGEGVAGDALVDLNPEFYAGMKVRIGEHGFVLFAEIDAEIPEAGHRPSSYIELKTSKKPETDRDFGRLYLEKYRRCFLQAYLAGIDQLFIGMRDENGILRSVERVQTDSLHHTAVEWRPGAIERQGEREARGEQKWYVQRCWKPSVCLNFIDHVCGQVRKACAANVGKTVRFTYRPDFDLNRKNLVGKLVADDSLASRIRSKLDPGDA